MERHDMKQPPSMGELKQIANAQALTLRAELRVTMQLNGLAAEEVARDAKLDVATLQAFLAGASINPRWQEKLARWLQRSEE